MVSLDDCRPRFSLRAIPWPTKCNNKLGATGFPFFSFHEIKDFYFFLKTKQNQKKKDWLANIFFIYARHSRNEDAIKELAPKENKKTFEKKNS